MFLSAGSMYLCLYITPDLFVNIYILSPFGGIALALFELLLSICQSSAVVPLRCVNRSVILFVLLLIGPSASDSIQYANPSIHMLRGKQTLRRFSPPVPQLRPSPLLP